MWRKNKITPENDLKKKNCCKIDVLKPFAWVSIFVEFSNRQKISSISRNSISTIGRFFFLRREPEAVMKIIFVPDVVEWIKIILDGVGEIGTDDDVAEKKLLSRATLTVRETLDDSMAVGASLNMTHSKGFVLNVWLVCLSCNLYQW